jgi:DNA-binding FadR family transcriptional regulator
MGRGPKLQLPAQPLTRGVLADQIVDLISEQVLSGQLAPGELLPPERVLSSQFGVSKAAVREASKVLASKGLVSIRQGVGVTVNSPERWNVLDPHVLLHSRGETTLEHLLDARRIIEPEIAARAAQLRDDDTLRQIADAVEQGATITTVEEHIRWDMAFHQALAEATGNPVLVILMNSIGQLLRASRAALFTVRGAVGRSVEHHQLILDQVRAGNADGSHAAMLDHLRQVADDLKLLREEEHQNHA